MKGIFAGLDVNFTEQEITEDLVETIRELERLLLEAKRFQINLAAGTLQDEDGYLSFGRPLLNGYDRTGPEDITYTEDEC